MSLFIAGTDTGIGKTVVSGILALKLGYQYWKPVQSGWEGETDSEWIAGFLGKERVLPEAYRLRRPLSPHEAARLEGIAIDIDSILEKAPQRPTVIEGAGGVLTPLHERFLFADLIGQLAVPVVLVAKSGLGTINHSLLTLEALRRRGIEPLGVVLVGEENPANRAAIEFHGKTSVLGRIPLVASFSREILELLGKEITLENTAWKRS